MIFFCDNTTTIKIVDNLVQHKQTKHIKLDRNCISNNLNSNVIEVCCIKRVDPLTHMMTHAVNGISFYTFLSKLDMNNIYRST